MPSMPLTTGDPTLAGASDRRPGRDMCARAHPLRIIDLSPEADQPMPNEDGTVWLAYNGELYNHRSSGVSSRRRPRVPLVVRHEVLVHLYEQVDGDLTDASTVAGCSRSPCSTHRAGVVLARDRLGIKPMYWADIRAGSRSPPRRGRWCGQGRCLAILTSGPRRYLVWGRMSGERTLLRGVRADAGLVPRVGSSVTRIGLFRPRSDPPPTWQRTGCGCSGPRSMTRCPGI